MKNFTFDDSAFAHTHTHTVFNDLGTNTVGVYMSSSDNVDVVENIFYAPPQPPSHFPEHYTFHACVEMEGENRNARVNCNTFQQPFYGIKLTDAIVDDFGSLSVGANNVFMQNVQWTTVPIQNAIYGNTLSFKPTYYADLTNSSVINGFETGTRPTQFGGENVSGQELDIDEISNIDGCEPDPLPTDELNVNENDLHFNDNGISLYPNPSMMNGEINIVVSEFSVARIVDVQGRDIANWNLSEGINTKAIDLPSGLYYVNIVSKSRNKAIKWIVQ